MAAGEPVKELAQPDKGACLDNRIEPSSDDDSTAVKDVKADAPVEEMKVSYGKLYSQADNFDTILMALGAVGSVANGEPHACWHQRAMSIVQLHHLSCAAVSMRF